MPPSLCLVDAWVTVSDAHQQQLRFLDEIEQPWVSVLVPWNIQDAELSDAQHDLRDRLVRSLGRRLASVPRRCQLAATGIPTLQEFGQILEDDDDHAQEIPQGRPCIPAGNHRYCAPTAQDGGPSGPRRILMSDSCDGQIITFYSYKGGTGRTMALANVAWILASNSSGSSPWTGTLRRPGCTDSSTRPARLVELRSSPGLIDLMWEFATVGADSPASLPPMNLAGTNGSP